MGRRSVLLRGIRMVLEDCCERTCMRRSKHNSATGLGDEACGAERRPAHTKGTRFGQDWVMNTFMQHVPRDTRCSTRRLEGKQDANLRAGASRRGESLHAVGLWPIDVCVSPTSRRSCLCQTRQAPKPLSNYAPSHAFANASPPTLPAPLSVSIHGRSRGSESRFCTPLALGKGTLAETTWSLADCISAIACSK